MAEPIRIGFVLHTMQVAGAEVLVAETIRRLGARVSPVVLCLDQVGQLGERMRAENVEVVAFERKPGLDFGLAGRLAREIAKRRLEVVHAHQYTPFFYSALAKARGRTRFHLMFTEHGRHYPDVVSAKRRLANRWFLSRLAGEVNGVCGFSTRSLAEVEGFANRTIEVIPNGIDLERYQPAPDRDSLKRSLGLDPARRYIICVARFHPVKDHAMLIRAFAAVAAKHADVDLLLAGDGPLRSQLQKQVEDLGLAARVRFLGVRDDVPALLGASDVFTLTSISEAASITLLEAMASRLPVVITDVGGNPELARDGQDGVLVPRGDADAQAAALGRLLDDPALACQMGASGRRRVEESFRLDDTIEEYYRRYAAAAERLRSSRRRPGPS